MERYTFAHPMRYRVPMLLLSLAAGLGVIGFYARRQTDMVLLVAVEESIYLALYALPAALLGYALLHLIRPANDSRSLRWSTSLGLGLGTLGLLELGLGLAGWLNLSTLCMLLAASVLAGVAMLSIRRRKHAALTLPAIGLPWMWPVVAVYLSIAILSATLLPGSLWPDDPHWYDVLVYHLQVPREWFELGRIIPLEHNVFSFFPFNIEIHYLAMMHLRGSSYAAMYQAQLLGIVLSCASAMAIWSAVRPISRPGATLAAFAFLLTPWVTMLSSVAYVEPGQMFFVALSMAWLLSARQSSHGISRAVLLAGIFSGLAAGTKLTSLAMFTLPATLFILIALPLHFPLHFPRRLGLTTLFLLATLLPLSPWLVRNYIWSGNPVFPLALEQLGKGHFTPDQLTRFERAHLPTANQQSIPARLQAASDQIVLDWRMGFVLLPVALVSITFARRRPETWLCVMVIAGTAVIWLTMTHLQGRFFTIALPALCIAAGLLPQRAIPWLSASFILSATIGIIGLPIHSGSTQIVGLHTALQPACENGRKGLFGLTNPYPALPMTREEVRANIEAGRTVLFVGGGAIFLQPWPMRQIRYRTVFDVDASNGRDAISAWYGPSTTSTSFNPAEVVPIISLSELHRLHSTYFAIPEYNLAAAQRFPNAVVTP